MKGASAFTLPVLPYGYGDLAPVLSERTLHTHHARHHARYVQVVNDILARQGRRPETLEEVVLEAHRAGDAKLFNNAAQAWNHGFFWASMRPEGSAIDGELARVVEKQFGGSTGLRDAFLGQALDHFGSGWAWLVARGDVLSIVCTHDAATPLTQPRATPLLVCDLWEHAYYLDYKNNRAAFLWTWWAGAANWAFAARQFETARGGAAAWRYPTRELAA